MCVSPFYFASLPAIYVGEEAVYLDLKNFCGDKTARLTLCVVAAVGVVYAAESWCQGKELPLWERYGPWIKDNKLQAIALAAAVLYGLSLALWPEEEKKGGAPEGFTPCP